jgi:hypothetical protein
MRAQRLVSEVDARLGLHGRLVIWLFALLLLSRFSILGAALTVVVVSGQVFLGSRMIERYGALRALPALSRIGISFCVGATVSTFIYIAIVTFSNRWLAILGQVGLLVCVWRLRRVSFRGQAVAASSEEKLAVKWIVVVTLLGLSPDWFWPLPVAIVLALSIFVFDRVRGKSITVRVFAAAACGAVASFVWLRVLDTRPIRPWFADDRFAEIFSFSLGRWGVSHNPVLVGETISYHWFSYAWFGAVSNLSGVQISEIVPLFGPVIVASISAIICVEIARLFSHSRSQALVVAAVIVLVDTERYFRGFGFHAFQLASFSQFFSFPFGLSIVLLLARLGKRQLCSIPMIVGIILAGVIGAKSSSGLVVVIGLLGISFQWFFNVNEFIAKFRFIFFALFLPIVISGLFFYGNPVSGTGSAIRRPGWPVGVSRDLWDVYNGDFIRFIPVLIFLTLALAGLGLNGLLVIALSKKESQNNSTLWHFSVFGFIAAIIQMWIAQSDGSGNLIGESDNTLWALQFFASLAVVVGVSIVSKAIAQLFDSRQVLFLYTLLLPLLTVVFSRRWKIELGASYWTPFLESLKPALPFLSSLVVSVIFGALLYVGRVVKLRSHFKSLVPALFSFSILGTGLLIFATNYISTSQRQQSEWTLNDFTYKPSANYVAASLWINTNSSKNELVATKVTSRSPNLSELTDRKEFAGFDLLMRVAGSYSDYEKVKRMYISDFANLGDCESAEGLRASEVAYVLVDLTNPETPDVERCAEEVFRNETVIVYSLK